MLAILTGDIINSRKVGVDAWLPALKYALSKYGSSPQHWDIFRGDSFQLQTKPQNALHAAFHIKAIIRHSTSQDVRIAIGIGAETYSSNTISESNGPAYIRSGNSFESQKKQRLSVISGEEERDNSLNLMLSLALLTANHWSKTVAEVIAASLEHPNMRQVELAKHLNKSQSSISEALKRGGYYEITNLIKYYNKHF